MEGLNWSPRNNLWEARARLHRCRFFYKYFFWDLHDLHIFPLLRTLNFVAELGEKRSIFVQFQKQCQIAKSRKIHWHSKTYAPFCQNFCRILTNLTVQFVEFIELVEFRLTVELVELQPNCIAIVLKLPPFFLLSIASRGSIQAMGCWSRKIP